ncbi:MAG: polysaccharide deacetylase family protein [Candidatus Eisenbacteria sp.]|nr:polysaccharide deacetylase family protein [Candidatus Eisenbacteria bacterium]
MTSIPILVYHDIDPGFRLGSLNPTLRQFEAQMRYLKEEGFQTVDLDSVVQNNCGKRCVCVTFDDAYEGVVRYALPVLTRYGFRATVFVVTGYVGVKCEWDLNLRWLGAIHMDWEGVRELDGAGMTIGSHTVRHPNLTTVGRARADRELRESKQDLEDALGRSVDRLSYPFGQYNDEVKQAADVAGYRLACTIRPRRGSRPDDPLALKRICIRSIDSLWDFRTKVQNGGPSRYQDWKEGFLAACNRSSLFARRVYDRRESAV